MKLIPLKNIKPTNSNHPPFFQKEGNKGFFGKSNEPFFNSTGVQAKLSVDQPGTPAEQEADAMADKVVQQIGDKSFSTADNNLSPDFHNSNSIVQRKCTECEKEQKLQKKEKGDEKEEFSNELQTKPIFESNAVPPEEEKNIQRKCAECEQEEKLQKKTDIIQRQEEPNSPPTLSGEQPQTATSQSAPTVEPQPGAVNAGPNQQGQFIVEDTITPAEGQMRKSDFLERLNTEVCSTVDAALQGTPFSSDSCPYIRAAFARYKTSTPLQLELTIQRYEPSARSAQNAQGLIQQMKIHVSAAATRWVQTGDLSGVPEDIAAQIPPGVQAMSGVAKTAGNISQTISSGIGSIASGIKNLLFKANPGGGHATQSPASVMQSLGKGSSLNGSTRGKMESAFATDFSNVEVHTDSKAASLAAGMNARAFAVGNHVAFGSGEHKPGTLVGDALMAHELAHVQQQREDNHSDSLQKGDNTSKPLEEEADISAVGAVVSVWGGVKGALKDIGKMAKPRLKTGLRLQSCKSARQKEIERLGGLQSGFLEEKRKKMEEEKRRQAEEDAKKRGEVNPKIEVKVTLDDVIKEDVKNTPFTKSSADPWEKDIAQADRDNWTNVRAPKAWSDVLTSVKGTELEKVLQGKSYKFEPKKALENGWYAWQSGTTYNFGMSWVQNVEADPKNAWPNIAHEMGGHYEYGKTYASEVMSEAISKMPKAERDAWLNDPAKQQEFHDRYEYPETEIFAALREKRYADPEVGPKPTYGGLKPWDNIPDKLARLKDALQPEVAKAVLKELKRRVDANAEILPRDKKYYVDQVKLIFGYEP